MTIGNFFRGFLFRQKAKRKNKTTRTPDTENIPLSNRLFDRF